VKILQGFCNRVFRPPELLHILRVTLAAGADVRQFCQVNVVGNDVYLHQPHLEKYVKTSYHDSGARHQKKYDSGNKGPAVNKMWLERPESILTEDVCWDADFHNFPELIHYRGEPVDGIFANEVFNIDLPAQSEESITMAQLSVGRCFPEQRWEDEGVKYTTLRQKSFQVETSPAKLSVCVRVVRLALYA
jgi:hypothetical protein